MDDVKIGDILLPGEKDDFRGREEQVRAGFWPTFRKAVRRLPFARDVVAAFYCAFDPQTPLRVRGILLAALGYFVLPADAIPDIFTVVGFTDDIAVLTAAFSLVKGHLKDRHYVKADAALADRVEARDGKSA